MIVVKVQGGLGNQMFQYALARALAIKNQSEVHIDKSAYFLNQLRRFELNKFQCEFSIAGFLDRRIFDSPQNRTLDRKLFGGVYSQIQRRRFADAQPRWVKEQNFNFDQSVLSLKPPLYLDGYWQSPKYFSEIQGLLCKEFKLRDATLFEGITYLSKARSDSSVAIHFRRGDYVSTPATYEFHGSIDLSYYWAAIEVIRSKIAKPQFYVFSDDIAWVRQHFILEGAQYVGAPENLSDVAQLTLMSYCRAQIIANSTFSWWAAYLNSNPKKIVVAPSRWFSSDLAKAKDLFLKEWLVI